MEKQAATEAISPLARIFFNTADMEVGIKRGGFCVGKSRVAKRQEGVLQQNCCDFP